MSRKAGKTGAGPSFFLPVCGKKEGEIESGPQKWYNSRKAAFESFSRRLGRQEDLVFCRGREEAKRWQFCRNGSAKERDGKMMTIYTGRAQCGKTSRLLEQIGQRARQGRKQILVVPEMLSHEMERRLLQVCGNPVARWAEVLTFQRAAQRILQQAGQAGRPRLDAGGRVLAMHRAILEVENSLEYYQTAGARPEMVERLVSLVDELKACRIQPEQLLQAAGETGSAAGKIRDLGLLYAAYCGVAGGLALDDKDLLTAAAQALPDCGFGQGWDFYFDGFSGFTAQERHLIELWLGRGQEMAFALLYQPGDSLFFEQEKLLHRLQAMAQRSGVRCQVEALERQADRRDGALEKVEQGLFDYGASPWQGPCASVRLYRLPTPEEECEFAASLARQAMAQGMRCREIALAAGDIEPYQPLLENAFAKFEVPLFLAEKSDILQKPVLAAANGALQAVAQGMRYEAVFAYLRSGLSPLEEDEVDRLENYVLTWNIRGKEYFRPFVKNPAGYESDRAEWGAEQLPELEAIRQKMAGPLELLQQKTADCKEGAGFARALGEFLQQIGLEERILEKVQQLQQAGRGREAAEYSQLYQILQGAVEQFAAAMEGLPMDAGEFLRLWRLMLGQYSVAAIPVALDNVQAGSFERMSFHGIRLLIVLGARDGALPPEGGGSGLLTEQDRAKLLQAGVELTETAEEHAYESQSHVYRGFAAPEEQLVVLYPEKSREGGASRPSYLLRRLQNLLPGLAMEVPDDSWRLAARRPSFELACASVSGQGGQLAETARQLALDQGDHGAYFQRLRRYAASPRGPIQSKELIAAAYGRQVRMTASRAEQLASCRFSYFMAYGLRAKERKRAQFGAPETGTFLHYVVENTIREMTQHPDRQLRAVAQSYIQAFLQDTLRGMEGESARFQGIFRRVQRMVLAIVEDVWQELQNSRFVPIAFEMGFGPGQENPAIELEHDGFTIALSGKIDRLDGYLQDGTLYVKVADYKTGTKSFHLSDLLYGINMQMFLYLLMVRWGRQAVLRDGERAFGQVAEQVRTAGVLYIPAKTPYVTVEYGEEYGEVERKMSRELRRIGIVLDDPTLLEAMEQPEGGKFRFLPVSLKKDGSLSSTSSVTSSEGFARLVRGVDRQLRHIAQQIAQGDIEAQPVSTGPDWSACDWCPFRDACHFDETMKKDRRRKIRVLPDSQVYARLQEEEEEDGRHIHAPAAERH